MFTKALYMKEVAVGLWDLFEPIIPREQKCRSSVRRPCPDLKAVVEGILGMLQTGVQWRFTGRHSIFKLIIELNRLKSAYSDYPKDDQIKQAIPK